jgi:hypothetical protein
VEKLSVIPEGLRKAWLAFKIANGNGDIQKMRYYARIIKALQLQMRIQGTIFDNYLFDEEDERAFCEDL